MAVWKQDNRLNVRLRELVCNGFQQKEIVKFAASEFPDYAWSIRSLQERLRFFSIKCIDRTVDPEELIRVVTVEVNGAGGLLGYRALHRKIRNKYKLLVTRQDVYLAMNKICPEKLEERRLTNHRKKFKRRVYISKGANWTWSFDGHDKLSGRCKSEFPFGIHGGIDSFSRKVLWLTVWPSNCNPILPARLYYNAIIEHGYLPRRTRSDQGSENVTVAAMQNFLTEPRENELSNHIFGSSVTNQVIEQWWKGFRERHGNYFKNILNEFNQTGLYDETNSTCRVIMALVFIPLLQSELDAFKEYWNTHRIRKQNIYRPCGIPDYLYKFPDDNWGKQCGLIPDASKMKFLETQVAELTNMRFVDASIESEAKNVLKALGIAKVTPANAKNAYIALMQNFVGRILAFEYS